jgi:FkbM family methyltransferase
LEFFEFIFHLKLAIYFKRNLGQSSQGEFIFDVGANKGSMSKLFARLYHNTKIFAFEPLPIFQLQLSQVNLNQVAIGAHIGVAKFYICKHNASSSLILPDLDSKWLRLKAKILGSSPKNLYEEIEVEVTTIDKVVSDNSIKSIFILKIDTEGSELDVIDGARESLRSGIIRNIQMESHDNDLRDSHKRKISNLLDSYNYVHKKSIKHFFGTFTEEIFSKK